MFEFTDDCLIGHEAIDRDHARLFEIINNGYSILNNHYTSDKYNQIKNLLQELWDYAHSHFEREEAYMTQIRDPELIMQRVQHDHFKNIIWSLDFKALESDEHQQEVLKETLDFLTTWLYSHIIASDGMIGKLEPLEEWMVKENPCEFTDNFKTGITLLDVEHEMLFELSGKVYDILKKGATPDDADNIIAVLKELKHYTIEHFSDEEDYMRKINYSGLDAQILAHKCFIAELEDIDEDIIHKNPQEYVKSLLEFLLDWLMNHILKTDMLIPKE